MNPQLPRCFVVIVHYGDPAPTAAALQALLAGEVVPARILVVDHAEVPLVLPEHALVHIIRPKTNGGYAAGFNVGLGALMHQELTRQDWVIVLNNDVRVYPAALAALQQYQPPHPTVVGALVDEGATTWWGGGRVHALTGRAALLPYRVSDTSLREQSVAYIHGAFMAAPYHVWLALQGLPEKYFMYWEDVSLGRRAALQNIAQVVRADIRIHHRIHAITPQQAYYLVRNGAYFMAHETAWPLRWWWRGYNWARYLYHRARRHEAIARALGAARQGKLGQ